MDLFANMESIANRYMTKLRLIAKIPENGLLDLTNNDLNIYQPGLYSWFRRKLYGDGKANTELFLKNLYTEINSFTEELMKSIRDETSLEQKSRKTNLLRNLVKNIKQSIEGLKNLMKTYVKFPRTVSELESIEQDVVEPQLVIIAAFLQVNGKSYADKVKGDEAKENNQIQNNQIPQTISYSLHPSVMRCSPPIPIAHNLVKKEEPPYLTPVGSIPKELSHPSLHSLPSIHSSHSVKSLSPPTMSPAIEDFGMHPPESPCQTGAFEPSSSDLENPGRLQTQTSSHGRHEVVSPNAVDDLENPGRRRAESPQHGKRKKKKKNQNNNKYNNN